MPSEMDLINDVPTGGVAPFGAVSIPRTGSTLARAAELHRTVRDLGPQTAAMRRATLMNHWEGLQKAQANSESRTLLAGLSDAGMAWRDVARLTGVSVPAVQKWRRGDGITGVNHLKIAGVVALLACLKEMMINEPVSWLEMPLRKEVSVTPMDLLLANRYDLVLELASDEHAPIETANEILDEYDPEWHTTRVDDMFEVFMADDGVRSIRFRS